jgi:hypothetical protein
MIILLVSCSSLRGGGEREGGRGGDIVDCN